MTVDILKVGSGNIGSIKNLIENTNTEVRIISKPSELKSNVLVLPGVGSAGPFMARLRETGFDEAIVKHVSRGGRLLGICLGFQVMADRSEESSGVRCLGLIDGYVEKLRSHASHNSWEPVILNKKKLNGQSFNSEAKLSKKSILKGRVFYNHEYGFVSNDTEAHSMPISEELEVYSGLLVKGNVIGMQFHPEKSQVTGHQLISMIL